MTSLIQNSTNLFFTFLLITLSVNCGGSGDSGNISSQARVSPDISRDAINGINLKANIDQFNFDPQNLGSASNDQNSGYLELVINGETHSRMYGPWLYISKSYLQDGDNNISYNLMTTGHEKISSTEITVYHYHESEDDHTHGKPRLQAGEHEHDDDTSHNHENQFHVKNGDPVPGINISLIKDSKNGYNLKLDLENFNLTPENVNQDNVSGEGHAHLYINDTKITRLYEVWHHIPRAKLVTGHNHIKVELSANSHAAYFSGGEAIMAESMIMVEQ